MNNAKIIVIDDDASVRASLVALLSTYGCDSKGLSSALSLLQGLDAEPPDLILLDVNMPEMDGMSALRHIRAKMPDVPVIMVTGHGSVPLAVKALKEGAADFIEKPVDDVRLVSVIEDCLAARRESPAETAELQDIRKRFETLTPRELSVLRLVAEGHTSYSISANLGISKKTVDHHRANISAKLQATSVSQVIRYYLMMRPGEV